MTKPKVKISASKLKTLQSCSWLYFCQYILKVPQLTNLGASRGLCAHTVLECFANPRHKNHLEQAINLTITPATERLILKHCRKLTIFAEEDIQMIRSMIIVAAQHDFDYEGSVKTDAEAEFKIESDKYIINGFIDRKAHFEDGSIKIRDYKSSKQRFSREEIEGNIQGLMYSLACYKEHGVIPEVEFLFLRFPKRPVQTFEKCTINQLQGFEMYLESVAAYMIAFNEKFARSDMACGSKEKSWLCGKEGLNKAGQVAFICQYRKPSNYFIIKNEKGEITRSSFNKKDLTPKKGEKVEEASYPGCPAFSGVKQGGDFF